MSEQGLRQTYAGEEFGLGPEITVNLLDLVVFGDDGCGLGPSRFRLFGSQGNSKSDLQLVSVGFSQDCLLSLILFITFMDGTFRLQLRRL